MEKFTHCDGCKCAKLTIDIEGEATQTFVSNAPPLIVEVEEISEIYKHEMIAPINRNFFYEIGKVELVEGFWHYARDLLGNPAPQTRSACPMPGTYPILAADDASMSDVELGRVTDLYWVKNVLFCYFDIPGAYWNDSGFCTYKIFGLTRYKFSDRRGVLYQKSIVRDKLKYEISCDDCCKDTEIMCDHHNYPGYKCYPIPPVTSQLANNRYDISRFYK